MIFVEIFQSRGQQKHATHPTFLTEMTFVEIFQRGGQQKHATHPTENVKSIYAYLLITY